MAGRLSATYKVYIHDPVPATADYAQSIGAERCRTSAELAPQCTVIIISLPGPAQIETVVFGSGGLYDKLTSNHVIIDTSTVDPETSRSAAKRVGEKGCAYLDCPILGRPSAVGKWMLPAGGDEEVLDYVRPVLLTFAANVVHVGRQGTGNALKLLNQLMFSTINAISSEVLAICKHVGIDKEIFYRTVAESSAATVSGLFREVGRSILNNAYTEPNFTVDLLLKDARLALQMAKDSGAPSLVAGSVQLFNEIAAANGLGSQDSSSLYKIFNRNFVKET
jgi:3-hydroxyisobutyrate dehydrogenase-like beta-hydroxyacid dehydrogenase